MRKITNEQFSEISQSISQMVSHPLRPLSTLRSIKMKIGILVLGAVITTVIFYWIGLKFGFVWPSLTGVGAAIISLIITRFFASGLTSPLREMAEVSQHLKEGDYSFRVETNSQDEIGALAKTFNAMADELSKTDALRRELIANASHELKTPLTALQAQLENIVDGIQEPNPEIMNTLLKQTEHLSALVKQLLDLSKLESGLVQLELSEIKIDNVVNDALKVVKATYPSLQFEIEQSNKTITGDFHRLVQVFTNIFTNSAKYTPEDGLIKCSYASRDNNLIVRIEDNGIGIDANIYDQIFERFARADNSRNTKDGGAGIGLAITKQIVDMHNGRIEAFNSESGGCVINIYLPDSLTKQSSLNGNTAIETNTQTNNKEISSWHSIPSTTF